MRSPAFRFYADDFLAGTLEMTQEEVGAYIRLLCHQWNRGSIPVEPEKQQRLAGGSVSADVLAKFPKDENGLLKNQRLEREREKQAHFSESQRLKGKRSAEVRRAGVEPGLNRGSTEGSTEIQPSVSVSVSASVSDSKNPCSPLAGDEKKERLRLEIGDWFNRRPNTKWSDRELRALAKVADGLQDEDLELMRKRYTSGDKYLRKDILTLLNNWPGELDRARQMGFFDPQPSAYRPPPNQGKITGPLLEQNPEPADFSKIDEAVAEADGGAR